MSLSSDDHTEPIISRKKLVSVLAVHVYLDFLIFGAMPEEVRYPKYILPESTIDERSYLLYTEIQLTWNHARWACETSSQDRSLAKLPDQSAVNKVTERMKYPSIWIGLYLMENRVTRKLTPMWWDCSPYNSDDYVTQFENSDNTLDYRKRCAVVTIEKTWEWRDCQETHGFACENDPDDPSSEIASSYFPTCGEPTTFIAGGCPTDQCEPSIKLGEEENSICLELDKSTKEYFENSFCEEKVLVTVTTTLVEEMETSSSILQKETSSSVFVEETQTSCVAIVDDMQTSSVAFAEEMQTSSPVPSEGEMMTSSLIVEVEVLTSSTIVLTSAPADMALPETSSVPSAELVITTFVPAQEETSSLLLPTTSSPLPAIVTSSSLETLSSLESSYYLFSATFNDTVAASPAVCNTTCKAGNYCACRCVKTVVITHEEWRIIKESKSLWMSSVLDELSVNKSTVSANRRRYSSAKDTRKSVQTIGSVGIIVVIIFFGGIVLLDMSSLLSDFKMLIRNLRVVGNDLLQQG